MMTTIGSKSTASFTNNKKYVYFVGYTVCTNLVKLILLYRYRKWTTVRM